MRPLWSRFAQSLVGGIRGPISAPIRFSGAFAGLKVRDEELSLTYPCFTLDFVLDRELPFFLSSIPLRLSVSVNLGTDSKVSLRSLALAVPVVTIS